MQQDIAVEPVKALVPPSFGAVLAVSTTLSEQLNTTHTFLNLDLPYWAFLLSMVVLNFWGAYYALKTDYMKANGTPISNFFTAVSVGFIITFIILPTVSPTSSIGAMQIASFMSGLCGTIFLRVIINVINRQDLQDELTDLGVDSIRAVIKFAKKWRDKFLSLFGGAE